MKLAAKVRELTQSISDTQKERKRLRRSAGLSYAIADSIHMLNERSWGELTTGKGFFFSHEYLAALESVMPANMAPRYALIHENTPAGRMPVAAVYMQIVDIRLSQTRPVRTPSKEKEVSALDKLSEGLKQRVLTCGNLLSYGQHGIAFAPGVDAKRAWHGVVEVLYRVARAEKLSGKTHFVMIKDLHEPYTSEAKHLSKLSYRHVETDPNMVLEIGESWKSYDDYLASLSSKYRSNLKNSVMKPIEGASCTVEHLHDVASHEARLFDLYKAVHTNANFRPFTLRTDYFTALQRAAGEGFRCSVLKRGGELLGFLISVADGDTAIAYHIGFDRAAAEELPIYLRLLHAGIADGIALGCTRVSYGRTALEPKAVLGAKPQPFSVLVRHRQPVLNKMIKQLMLGIEHDEAPERNPFKAK